MAEQQRNMDYLNSTGDKFVKSLPRQRSEQLRLKLSDLNDKWRDINLHAEKRQNQVRNSRVAELRNKGDVLFHGLSLSHVFLRRFFIFLESDNAYDILALIDN